MLLRLFHGQTTLFRIFSATSRTRERKWEKKKRTREKRASAIDVVVESTEFALPRLTRCTWFPLPLFLSRCRIFKTSSPLLDSHSFSHSLSLFQSCQHHGAGSDRSCSCVNVLLLPQGYAFVDLNRIQCSIIGPRRARPIVPEIYIHSTNFSDVNAFYGSRITLSREIARQDKLYAMCPPSMRARFIFIWHLLHFLGNI